MQKEIQYSLLNRSDLKEVELLQTANIKEINNFSTSSEFHNQAQFRRSKFS